MPDPHRHIMIGEQLNQRYTIEDAIGNGGQADVFKATDSANGGIVVIKQLRVDPSAADWPTQAARFRRTASIHVPHPCVVNPIDLFEDKGLFAVYPWIDGRELGQLPTPMPWKGAVTICRALAGTIGSVHRAGIIHRDIKPANIIIDTTGTPHLIDFGVARIQGIDTLTPEGSAVGTPMYVAPEQLRGEPVDERTDVCSLGHVLYQLLTGQPSRGGNEDSIKQQALRETPPDPSVFHPEIPPALDAIVARMCALRPEDRYHNMTAVIDALDDIHEGMADRKRCLACGSRVRDGDDVCTGCRRAFGVDRYLLVHDRPSGDTASFLIPRGRYVIGRDQIAPGDPRVSRVQCAVGHGSDLVLRDADAKNPTTLDGTVVSSTTVARDGQRLALAGHVFRIERAQRSRQ